MPDWLYSCYPKYQISISDSKPKRRYDIRVLSGTAYVGQLYDATKDQLLHDRYLWIPYKIKLRGSNITNTFFDATLEENINDRMEKLDLEANLKMSFMFGLVKVSILMKIYCTKVAWN